MDRITDKLFLGDYVDALNTEYLIKEGITAVLNVSKDNPNYLDSPILRYHHPLIDGDGNTVVDLQEAVTILEQLLDQGHKVLVHCQAGVSRSPTVVIVYLARKTKQSFHYCRYFVEKIRPIVYPNKKLIELAKSYLGE